MSWNSFKQMVKKLSRVGYDGVNVIGLKSNDEFCIKYYVKSVRHHEIDLMFPRSYNLDGDLFLNRKY